MMLDKHNAKQFFDLDLLHWCLFPLSQSRIWQLHTMCLYQTYKHNVKQFFPYDLVRWHLLSCLITLPPHLVILHWLLCVSKSVLCCLEIQMLHLSLHYLKGTPGVWCFDGESRYPQVFPILHFEHSIVWGHLLFFLWRVAKDIFWSSRFYKQYEILCLWKALFLLHIDWSVYDLQSIWSIWCRYSDLWSIWCCYCHNPNMAML